VGGHLFLYEKIATSSTPSNPLAASPELFPVSTLMGLTPPMSSGEKSPWKSAVSINEASPPHAAD
jgi:hypothetical protein